MTDHSTARALVERLRDADANSVQRCLGSRIFAEAADFIEQSLTPPEGDIVSLPDALAKQVIDRTIERCKALPDYAGRPAWDEVLADEIRAALQSRVSPQAGMREALDRLDASLETAASLHSDCRGVECETCAALIAWETANISARAALSTSPGD